MAAEAEPTPLSALLLQTPPGQLAPVLSVLSTLACVSSTSGTPSPAFSFSVPRALQEHAEEQLLVVDSPAGDAVVVCKETATGEGRYRDVKGKATFAVDFKSLKTSAPRELSINTAAEPLRIALHKHLDPYVRDHFAEGAVGVVPVALGEISREKEAKEKAAVDEKEENAATAEDEKMEEKEDGEAKADAEGEGEDAAEEKESEPAPPPAAAAEEEEKEADEGIETEVQGPTSYVIHIVGNKYNLPNYWAGRWRATYRYDPSARMLSASHKLLVHYFENGNVQLSVSSSRSLSLSSSSSEADAQAAAISDAVQAEEARFHASVDERVRELGEKAFKALRRNLPVSKQKINWEKVSNYKISSELAK